MTKIKSKVLAVSVLLVFAIYLVAGIAYAEPSIPGEETFISLAQKILNFIGNIGILLVVGAFMITGYKIACTQDPRTRAEAMHSLIPIGIGAFIAFGAKWIANWIASVARSVG